MTTDAWCGNPDRQGEAGAGELLFNPWARSAGLHSMNTSSVFGVEAMRVNIAGMGRIDGSELVIANTRLFEGSTLKLNSLGYVTRVGGSGAFGLTLTTVDFGEIPITTTNQPEGTGGFFSPSFFQLGLGYAYTYENKISVGLLVRGVTESLPDVSAFGLALDAGVQYVSGERDEFKLGIALRNIGAPMSFGGEGLSFQTSNPEGPPDYLITVDQRSEGFELPSTLNIGLSYDYYVQDDIFIRGLGNFTSNAFSRDQIGAGLEGYFFEKFMLRLAYKSELGSSDAVSGNNIYTGLAGGASVLVPLKKDSDNKVGFDYAYRVTDPFRGSHNFSVRLLF